MKPSARKLFLTMLAGGIALLGYAGQGQAQALFAPGNTKELRPAYATSQDVAEGKRVAEASCASCHGIDGVSKTKGTPNIAGQRPAYLYTELRAYQAGDRGKTSMNNAVKFLSDDALVKVAAYYTSLDPAPPARAAKKSAPKPSPLAAGKAAAAGCGGCHGDNGVSKTPGMPNLAGLDPKYIVAAANAYKTGRRKHDMMKTMVSAVSAKQLSNIALYFASQKPERAQTPARGDKEAGKAAAVACAGCHGEGGVSTSSAPSLAGQDAQYIVSALKEYKKGTRAEVAMKGPATSLDEDTIRNIAAYYASQTPQRPKFRKPLTTAEMTQRCNRCHGVNGNSTDPRLPALAAQRAGYLEKAMHAYRDGTRRSKIMAAMMAGVSDSEMEALAAHYSQQKGRSVVYIPLPQK